MRKTYWIAVREFSAYVFRPLGWFLIAGFLAVSGWYFAEKMEVEATTRLMRSVLSFLEDLSILVVPLIAMRTFAGERQDGTLETLMTAPVRESEVVAGKFLGSFLFYTVLVGATGFYALILSRYGTVDPGPVVAGYAGTLLAGASFLSLGLFLSSVCSYQLLAALFTFLIILVLRLVPTFALAMDPGGIRDVLMYLNYRPHLAPFRRGIVDTRHLTYFLSSSILFLGGTVIAAHARRWS